MTIDQRLSAPRDVRLWARLVAAIVLWVIVYAVNRPFWDWLLFDTMQLDSEAHLGAAVEFFFYDSVKIALLLGGIIFAVTVLRSFARWAT